MSPVSIAREGDVSVITVDNPPVNALSQAVRQGLVECIEEAEADAAVAAIVIVCAGRHDEATRVAGSPHGRRARVEARLLRLGETPRRCERLTGRPFSGPR